MRHIWGLESLACHLLSEVRVTAPLLSTFLHESNTASGDRSCWQKCGNVALIFDILCYYMVYLFMKLKPHYYRFILICANTQVSTKSVFLYGDLYLKGVRFVADMCTLNICSVCFCQSMQSKYIAPKMDQHHQISIKYFPIKFNVDGINNDLQHIKYDYV